MVTKGVDSPPVIADYYATCLKRHGDTAEGAGWPNEPDRRTRFDVMAAISPQGFAQSSVLDMACGTGVLLDHLTEIDRLPQSYLGIDINAEAIARAREKHPDERFRVMDLLSEEEQSLPPAHDFVLVNGLFTVRATLSEEAMWGFLRGMLNRLWPLTRRGLAFNVMSDVVDWRREDLFHVPMDDLARELFALAGRRVVFRTDYDLYEYTAYVYRDAFASR